MLRPFIVIVAAAMLITGCSGSDAQTASPNSGAASRSPAGSASAATSATGKAGAVPAAPRSRKAPKFASCKRVGRSAASAALGETVKAGRVDRRIDLDGLAQVDGCVYEGTNGVGVSYVMWWSPKPATATVVRQGLAPTAAGAIRFAPRVGTRSAGSQTSVPRTVQVNAARGRYLVQVTLIGVGGAQGRSAAVTTARTAVNLT